MDAVKVLDRIPDYKTFYTVDELKAVCRELAEKHPETVEVFTLGYSRKNDDIPCIKVGHGNKNAIAYACPHPNEPIGAMTVITLAKLFAEDPALLEETGLTWYLIPSIDPDGTRLNEAWFKGPFDLTTYDRNFYRPAGNQQVEWTFPYRYKDTYFDSPIPETQALMKLINDTKPAFMYSLHNASFGGAYWYITKNFPELNPKLENCAVRQGVPLHRGEPEASYCDKYSKSVFSMLSTMRSNALKESKGIAIKPGRSNAGTCCADYVATVCDCVLLMAELPYFNDPTIADESPSDMTRRDAAIAHAHTKAEILKFIEDNWQDINPLFDREDNPFPGLVNDCIRWGKEGAARGKPEDIFVGPEYERTATVAEKYDNLVMLKNFDILNVGLAARACECALAKEGRYSDCERKLLADKRDLFLAELARLCAELEAQSDYTPIPIKKLVSIQVESALHTIQYI